jgi:hypothetical protein
MIISRVTKDCRWPTSETPPCWLVTWTIQLYSTQITSWSPQGRRVLRQCKVPRAELMFVTIKRENIRPSTKEMKKAVTMLPNCPMFAVRLWITTSPYRWPIGSLPSPACFVLSPHCTKGVYTRQASTRDLWTVQCCSKQSLPCLLASPLKQSYDVNIHELPATCCNRKSMVIQDIRPYSLLNSSE